MNKTVTIDAEHVYHDAQGRIVPGVTGIIRACGLMNSFGWNDYARDRGTAVHLAIQLFERGTLDTETLDPVIVPYLNGWHGFKCDTGYECEASEQIIFNPTYRYAGTLDQIGFIGRKTCVLDIKTGAAQPWWALQTAAYNAVAGRQERYSLELRADCTWKLLQHTEKNDLRIFLACLTVSGWKAK